MTQCLKRLSTLLILIVRVSGSQPPVFLASGNLTPSSGSMDMNVSCIHTDTYALIFFYSF